MKIFTLNRFSVIIALILLTACAHTNNKIDTNDHQTTQGISSLTTTISRPMVAGHVANSVNDILKQESNLSQVLDGLNAEGGNLGQKIQYLRQANEDATKGIGGIYGHIFLDTADRHLNGGNWNGSVSVTETVLGKIEDYEFDYDTRGGKLHVTTLVTSILTNPAQPINIKKVAYHWQVEVKALGFNVHENCLIFGGCKPAEPEQPFPGTMTLDDDMIQEVMARNLQYKLWAKGEAIEVKEVFKKNLPMFSGFPPPPSTSPAGWIDLKNIPKYQGLFVTTAESCIDMMTETYPPRDITSLPPVPFYCLGRCDHPLIVNSR